MCVHLTLFVCFIKAGFGANQSTFGVQPQQQQQSLFGTAAPTGFGANTGTSLFGNTNQSSIFGSTSTQPSAFGQQATTSTFGRPSVGTNMFGSTQPTTGFGATAFGSSTPFGGSATTAFGSNAAQVPNGTTIKFVPVTGTDTMMKNGVNQQISTRHQCITAMKEYETKSLEELRMEDYLANRKGGGTSAFGLAQPQSGTTSLFGAPNLTATSSGAFGSSLFNQPKPGFGTSIAPSVSTSNSIFGSSFQQNKPAFGATNIFGATPSQTAVQQSQPSLFGTQPQQQQPLAFGQTQNTFSFGSSNQNQAPKSLFGSTSNNTSVFNNTLGNAFNSGNASKPLFGATTSQPAFGTSTLGASTSFPTFSTPATSTSTSSLFSSQPQQQNSLFSAASKPFSFNTATTFGSTAGAQPLQLNLGGTSSLFSNNNTFGTPNMFGTNPGQSSLFAPAGSSLASAYGGTQQQSLLQQPASTNDLLLSRLQNLPYGSSSLFKDDLKSISTASTKFTTDPKTLNQYRLNSRPHVQIQRTAAAPAKSSLLFDEIEEKDDIKLTAQDIFCPRKNIKRLVFKPKSTETSPVDVVSPEEQVFHDARNTSASDQIESTVCEFIPRKTNNPISEKDDSIRPLNFSLDTITSGDDSVQSVQSRSSFPVLRCGLVQTRCDYYTIPMLDAIDACYNEEADTCILENFTVGRKFYGSIYWEGPLDVKGLNLDELVHIRRKEVIVYPEDQDKPPVGHGLNRPAQITLDQVWPIDKVTNEVIRDPTRLEEMRYAEKIECATNKLKATFRDYRPDTGSWVFCVKHFSKYGIVDDDENGEPLAAGGTPMNAQPPLQPINEKARRHEELVAPNISHREVPEKTVIHKISAFSTSVDKRFLDFPSAESFPFKSGFDAFEERFQPPTDYYGGLRSVLFGGEDDEEVMLPSPKQKKQKVVEFELTPSPTGLRSGKIKRRNEPSVIVTTHQRRQLDWFVDPFPSMSKVILDISSIKCSPCSRVCFTRGSSNFVVVAGRSILFSTYSHIPDVDSFSGRMDVQLKKNSLIRTQPQVMAFAETIEKSCNSMSPRELNQLVVALFGDLKTTSLYEQQAERINNIIEWLSIRNRKHRLPSDSIDKIFHYLCINDVLAAVDEALKSKNPRLATLLSTSTCSSSKEYTLFQLDSWKTSQADNFIDQNLMKLYILISGIGTWVLSSGEQVSAYEGLSWSQQLILMLRYNLNSDLKECIAALDTDSNDVEYHLLAQLDGDQWISLNKCQDDLESWFLLTALRSYNVIQNDVRIDGLCGSLVSHLTPISTPWSVFVAQHILDDDLRLRLVREVISREGFRLAASETDWIVDMLAVPSSEISLAKSTFYKSSFEDAPCALALMDCRQWSTAHDILVERIFPELVISEDLDTLSNLVSRLKKARDFIPNWFSSGGHLFDVFTAAKLGTGDGVLSLLQQSPAKINLMKCSTNRHVLAQCEMALALNKLAKTSNSDRLLVQLSSDCAPIIEKSVM